MIIVKIIFKIQIYSLFLCLNIMFFLLLCNKYPTIIKHVIITIISSLIYFSFLLLPLFYFLRSVPHVIKNSDARMLSENSYDKLSVDEVYTFSNKNNTKSSKNATTPRMGLEHMFSLQ